jgi:hypothetical protein
MSTPQIVERNARIFRFGHYPGKSGYSVTRDQFIAANGETGTIPIGFDPKGLKHYHGEFNALDGETGVAEFSIEGDEVFATARMPELIDRLRQKFNLKISSVLGRKDHVLRKIDLVENSHIKDAVFFAEDDEVVMFEDDEPADSDNDKDDDFAQIHHEVIAGMASHAGLDFCHPSGNPGAAMHGPGHKMAHALRVAHDHCVTEGGAYCPGMDHPQHEEVGMSDDIDPIEYDLEEAVVSFSDDQIAELPARDQQQIRLMRKLHHQNMKLMVDNASKDAVSFADSVTKGDQRKAYPHARNAIIDGYKRAAAIDANLGDVVEFSDEKGSHKGSHVDAFKATILALPRIVTRPEDTVGFDLATEPDEADTKKAEADRAARRKKNLSYANAKAD